VRDQRWPELLRLLCLCAALRPSYLEPADAGTDQRANAAAAD
jgi:hypothetical protein